MNGKVALVLDLDDTLVDTSCLSTLRELRRWRDCAARARETHCYPGMVECIETLRLEGVKIGVVTKAVSYYASALLNHHGLRADCLIAYHDSKIQKPHPAPVLLCLQRLECSATGSLGVGDSQDDALAYKAAGIAPYGAGWSAELHRDAPWVKVAESAEEVTRFFMNQ